MSRLIKACEVQPGDTVQKSGELGDIKYREDLPVAKVWDDNGLLVLETHGGMQRYFNPDHELTLLDRPTPQLPTEPGSVITAYEVHGVRNPDGWRMMLIGGGILHSNWICEMPIQGNSWKVPAHITDWRPFPDPATVTTNKETGHEFQPVNGHPDDDECTHRVDGTDATYCGEPEAAHQPTEQEPGR